MIYVGFLLSFVISPASANTMSTAFSFWIGTILMSVSVLSSVAAHLIDRWAAAQQLLRSQPRSTSTNNMESSGDEESKRYSSSSVL